MNIKPAYPRRKGKRDSKFPLRKIVEVVRIGDNDLFGSGDKVLLECGHTVHSKGQYKARCIHCRK